MEKENSKKQLMSNPIEESNAFIENISAMIDEIISEEFSMLKNTSLLHDIVLNVILEKMGTVQKTENVLSYNMDEKFDYLSELSLRDKDVGKGCLI